MRDLRTALSRLRRFGPAGAALALLGTLLMATPAQAADPYNDLKIQNLNSRLCLSPAGGSTANNATIVQYLCQTAAFRTFNATWSATQHAYQIMNDDSYKCLSPAGGSTGLNVAIVQFTCDNDQSRYWNITKKSGVWTLQNLKSGLCISPAGGGTGLNTPMVQYTCDGNVARNWDLFTPVGIQSQNSGDWCATVAGGSATPNTVAVTYYCDMHENPARLWEEVATTTPNSIMLRNVATGLCL
jgi:cytolethal distending toxin subunit A